MNYLKSGKVQMLGMTLTYQNFMCKEIRANLIQLMLATTESRKFGFKIKMYGTIILPVVLDRKSVV
jgi:hypothetical protein